MKRERGEGGQYLGRKKGGSGGKGRGGGGGGGCPYWEEKRGRDEGVSGCCEKGKRREEG